VKRLLTVSFFTGLLAVLRMACGFLMAKVVAIYAGPTGLAVLGQLQSIVGALTGVVNAPVGSGVVRYTAEQSKDGDITACVPWWRAAMQWVWLLSMLVVPAGLLAAPWLAKRMLSQADYAWILMLAVLLLPVAALGNFCISIVNGMQQYRRYVALGAASTVLSATLMVLLVWQGGISGALLASALQAALIAIAVLFLLLRQPWLRWSNFIGSVEPERRRQIGAYILMALTSAIVVPLSHILLRSMLVNQLGWEAAGHWQAVWKISEAYPTVVTMALGTYFLPRLSTLTGVAEIRREILRTSAVVLPLVALLALSVYLLRDWIILLLFTPAFAPARDYFMFQLLGDVVKIASWLWAFPMLSRGATRWYIGSEVVFCSLLVVLAWWLTPMMGVKGATLAYLINISIYFVFVISFFPRFVR
jgi:O-antigen/teichoic acid export membrane protein